MLEEGRPDRFPGGNLDPPPGCVLWKDGGGPSWQNGFFLVFLQLLTGYNWAYLHCVNLQSYSSNWAASEQSLKRCGGNLSKVLAWLSAGCGVMGRSVEARGY